MLVKVTQEHIDKGRKNQEDNFVTDFSENCPVSLALKETFKVYIAKSSNASLTVGEFPEDSLIFTVPTPSIVAHFINMFDDYIDVEPFEFELSLEGVKL